MKLTCFFLAGSIAVCSAQVGSQNIIKQRAKDLRDQNNMLQGVPPPTPPAPQPQPATRPAAPAPTASQQNMTRLQSSLAAIKAGTPATSAQQQKLTSDLFGMVQGRGKPSMVTAEKFTKEVSAALAEKQLSSNARARLTQDLDGLLNPEKYPQAKAPAIIEDIQSLFVSNGLDKERATGIADLAKALSNEVQTNSR